jgi:hypothetical protein
MDQESGGRQRDCPEPLLAFGKQVLSHPETQMKMGEKRVPHPLIFLMHTDRIVR